MDLEDAIKAFQEAISSTLIYRRCPARFTSLGLALQSRYERFGEVRDLEGAIRESRTALELALSTDPERPFWLGNGRFAYEAARALG